MKRNVLILIFTALCCSCNDGKVDEGKIDAAGDKLQKTVEKGADTIGAKLERLKDRIDSSHRDTSRY